VETLVLTILFPAGTLATAFALGLGLRLPFHRWLSVKLWLASVVVFALSLWLLLWGGVDPRTSLVYAQTYYWGDFVCQLLGLLVLLRLAETAFKKANLNIPMLRGITVGIVVGCFIISFATIFSRLGADSASLKGLDQFALEAEQNLGLVGMFAAFLIWPALGALKIPGVRLRRLVAGFAVMYSSGSVGWALFAIFGINGVGAIAIPALNVLAMALFAIAMSEPDEESVAGRALAEERARKRRGILAPGIPQPTAHAALVDVSITQRGAA
jgi:hypothetical protein